MNLSHTLSVIQHLRKHDIRCGSVWSNLYQVVWYRKSVRRTTIVFQVHIDHIMAVNERSIEYVFVRYTCSKFTQKSHMLHLVKIVLPVVLIWRTRHCICSQGVRVSTISVTAVKCCVQTHNDDPLLIVLKRDSGLKIDYIFDSVITVWLRSRITLHWCHP